MKRSFIVTGSLFSLLISSSVIAAPIAPKGENNKVEWALQTSWPVDGNVVDMAPSIDGKYVYILNDKQQIYIYKAMGELQGVIPVEKGVSRIGISPYGDGLYLLDNKNHTFSAVGVSFVVDIDITGSPFEGPADAPVTIVVFTDFQCPFCSKLVPFLKEVHEKNPQTVKIVLKNMPLSFHKMAEPSAKAAMAAFEQGKFWEFHDQLFANNENLSDDLIEKIAKDLNLDIDKFHQDMKSDKIMQKIQKDVVDAQQAGVTGTPSVYINGRLFKGQKSLETFQAVIDEELKHKK